MLTPAPGDSLADTIGKLVRCLDDSPLTFLRHLGDDDVYHRGPVPGGSLHVIPGIWSGMPPPLLHAMRARRYASITGRCRACTAALSLSDGQMRHERDCTVADDNLRPMLTAWLRRVGRYAWGRRLIEDPRGHTP